jgi:kynureninase
MTDEEILSGPFVPGEFFARRLDAADPLRSFREQFLLPRRPDGTPLVYLCGHSLGLQPVAARTLVEEELNDWASLGVEGHFRGKTPWYSYHQTLRDAGARLVGALPHEVVFMNSLTVNLHLLMATFYRPSGARRCLLIDEPAFPSDLYAVQSQIRHHALSAAECLLTVRPRAGEHTVRMEDVESILEQRGAEIAVVWWNGVNFLTGQSFDLARLTDAAHRQGCLVGLDLAHAAGNVTLSLHDWDVDFAVWCSYKYLNGGPGAVAGAFVHERHGRNRSLPRLAGWWGNDPATRFRMQLQPDFIPQEGADGWQVSNPPILAMAPLRASLALFDAAGMPALREKSKRLIGYLRYLLERMPPGRFEVATPPDLTQRGNQTSLLVHDRPRELVQALEEAGIVCDFREPNVVRVAPVPLYNSYHDVWTFAAVLSAFFESAREGTADDGPR